MNFTFWNGIDKIYNPKGSNLDLFFLKTYWFWDYFMMFQTSSNKTSSYFTKLREKCPNKQLFLVRIFLYSDWIRRFTLSISVFRFNTGMDL